MRELLFLAHRIPYPPNKGDKIRSWNILRYLTDHFRVHLGCFIDDPKDEAHRSVLEGICESCKFVRLNPPVARLRSLSAIFSGAPLTLPYFWNSDLARWAEDRMQQRDIKQIFVFSSSMAQYAMGDGAEKACRVVDFVDIDSDKWRQYAEAKSWPANWIYGREGRTLLGFERKIAAAANASLFVSEAEAALFRELAPESAEKIGALNNGVDHEYFDPKILQECPFTGDGDALVFTGAMDYWANVDAVTWFAKDVFPGIRAKKPTAQFWIVGARPAAQVTALGSLPGVHVTGSVPDVRPYIQHAKIVVAPLRLARGIQNKVLEAMAMARPVVASPEALEGIAANIGEEVVRADDVTDFVNKTINLLDDTNRDLIGDRARKRVVSDYGWTSNLEGLKTLLEDGRLNLPKG
jgi:sugar transferase (PEP-CTERM/EpsH1 system associated)